MHCSPLLGRLVAAAACLGAIPGAFAAARVQPLAAWPAGSVALDAHPVGRVRAPGPGAAWRYQWPGTYFEARFAGPAVYVDLGAGAKHARVSVDDQEVADLVRPAQRVLRVDGLSDQEHQVRVDLVNESQAGELEFGGFALPAGEAALAPRRRARAIEFIGDSYTVGYGVASAGRNCSDDELWQATDTSRAFGPRVARHYGADYRVMAISGRGMVRNFGNFAGLSLPDAYARWMPALPEPAPASADEGWHPQLVVVGLGTNDFSTPVGAGEPWADGAGLAAAFEARYIEFVRKLHDRYPAAAFILLATDAGDGTAERAIRRVQARLQGSGLAAVDVLALGKLQLTGCHWHPSLADQGLIAQRLIDAIEKRKLGW